MTTTTADRAAMYPTETAPVALGYASPVPNVRPPKRMAAAVVALVVGLLLLVLSAYVLVRLVGWLMLGGLSPGDEEVLAVIACVFGGFCTVVAAIFLFVGLRWLGTIARAGG